MAAMGSFAGGLTEGFVQGSRLAAEGRANTLKERAAGLEIAGLQRKESQDALKQSRSEAADKKFGELMGPERNPDMLTVAKHAGEVALWAAQQGDGQGWKDFTGLESGVRKLWREQELPKAKRAFALSGNLDVFRPIYNRGVPDGVNIVSPIVPGEKQGEYQVELQFPGEDKTQKRSLTREEASQFIQNLDDPEVIAEREKAHLKSQAELYRLLLGKQFDYQGRLAVARLNNEGGLRRFEAQENAPSTQARIEKDKTTTELNRAKTERERRGGLEPTDPVLGLLGKRLGVDSLDGLTDDKRAIFDRGVTLTGLYRKKYPNANNTEILDAVIRHMEAEKTGSGGAKPAPGKDLSHYWDD